METFKFPNTKFKNRYILSSHRVKEGVHHFQVSFQTSNVERSGVVTVHCEQSCQIWRLLEHHLHNSVSESGPSNQGRHVSQIDKLIYDVIMI